MAERIAMGRLRACLPRGSTLAFWNNSIGLPFTGLSPQGDSLALSHVPRTDVRFASAGAKKDTKTKTKARATTPARGLKKGGPPAKKAGSAKGVGAGGSDKRDRFVSLIDSCLHAPAPVRALKEKDRLREIEREKLGIVSKEKERQLERERAKAKAAAKELKAKEKKKADAEGEETGDPQVEGEIDGERIAMELTLEEGNRLAKEYSRYLMKEARLKAAAENVRLQLKKDAIAALPPHLKQAALLPDLTHFPRNRIPAAISPPIGGYMEEMAQATERAGKIRKSR